MKDQYYGDINDYRKYGLLRAILRSSGVRLLVAWMLTPDVGSADGKRIAYLEETQETGKIAWHDSWLFDKIKEHLASGQKHHVGMMENSGLLEKASYFSDLVPDDLSGRKAWFARLLRRSQGTHLVFLDPDNGLGATVLPHRKQGVKYAYPAEVRTYLKRGQSVVIYHH